MARRFGIRFFWLILGLASLGLGMLGAILPLLPGTPFLLLAAFAFTRSSSKLAHWLETHPQFGPLIANWRDYGAISRRAKIASLVVILLTPGISLAVGVSSTILIIQIVLLSLVSLFILTRPGGPA